MTAFSRWAAAGFAVAVGFGLWAGMSGAADDKDPAGTIRQIAAALEKKDSATAKKLAAGVADKADLEDVMHVFSLRRAKGLGVGPTPGKIMPDGIEAKLIELSGKKPLTAAQLSTEADALVQLGYIAAAVGEVAHAKPPAKDEGKKKRADWLKWSADMRDSALQFAATAKEKKPDTVKKAATKLYSSCTTCHDVFKE